MVLQRKFTLSSSFDAAAYFDECFGVFRGDGKKTERIVLRAYGKEPYYLRDLPLHHSQKELSSNDKYTDFELTLYPTDDFKAHLLSLGGWVKVIEPKWLVDDMKEWIKFAQDRYKEKDE